MRIQRGHSLFTKVSILIKHDLDVPEPFDKVIAGVGLFLILFGILKLFSFSFKKKRYVYNRPDFAELSAVVNQVKHLNNEMKSLQ